MSQCPVPPSGICWQQPDEWVGCVDCVDDLSASLTAEAWRVASAYVYRQTGSKWPGECFVERARPCVHPCRCFPAADCYCGYNWLDLNDAGFCYPIRELIGVNVTAGECCPCYETGVWRPCDGSVRLEWVHRQPRLARQRAAGDSCCPMWWPQQDLCLPDGAPCTWSVDVRTGTAPPPDVLAATANLALEIAKECQAKGCSIPHGATSVTTRGARFERDPDQAGNGFWWSLLHDIIQTEKGGFVEQFSAPDTCGIEWVTVFGPTQFHMDACCNVVPAGEPPSCPRCPNECGCDPDVDLVPAAVALGAL